MTHLAERTTISAPTLSPTENMRPRLRILQGGFARYSIAFLCLVAAFLIGRLLQPVLGDFGFYVALFSSFAFAAWWCGLVPSVTIAVLAFLGLAYRSIYPGHALHAVETHHWWQLLAFVLTSAAIVGAGSLSRREAQKAMKLRGELEEEVKKRTAELNVANQGLSELTARLLHLQDEERRRIARDLHDSVGQVLTALGMNMSAVVADIERLMKTVNVVKDSQELVRDTVTSIRTLSYLLHPPLLDEKGLSSALPWYTQGFAKRSNISVNLALPDDFVRLSRDSEIAIFRIVQECLTNILRHSGGASARIRLTQSDDHVRVTVEDDGKGIPADKLSELTSAGAPGVGIRGMRERIRQLGGTLEISSEGSGKGTVVVARLPIVPLTTTNEETSELEPANSEGQTYDANCAPPY